MEHLKHFFKQKGLYLACLAVVFAATAAGVLALRSVLNHVVELTGTAQEETPWQDDTTVNKPDTTQPEPVRTPAPASSASPSSDAASGVPAASPTPAASAAPSGAAAKPSDFWQGKVLAPYSGDELVYNATLGDWRTHNGVDAAAAAGDEVPAVKGGSLLWRTMRFGAAWWRSLMQTAAPGGIAGLHPAVLWAAMRPPGM